MFITKKSFQTVGVGLLMFLNLSPLAFGAGILLTKEAFDRIGTLGEKQEALTEMAFFAKKCIKDLVPKICTKLEEADLDVDDLSIESLQSIAPQTFSELDQTLNSAQPSQTASAIANRYFLISDRLLDELANMYCLLKGDITQKVFVEAFQELNGNDKELLKEFFDRVEKALGKYLEQTNQKLAELRNLKKD